MALSKDDIFTIADAMAANGDKPTLAAIRKALGGGSFTTISEAMTEWKAKQHKTPVTVMKESAPSAIMTKLETLGGEIWGVALELANAQLNNEREVLALKSAECESAKEEAAALADQLSLEIEHSEEQRKALSLEVERLKTENAALRIEATKVNAEIQESRKRVSDLKVELELNREENRTMQRIQSEERLNLDAEIMSLKLELGSAREKVEKTEELKSKLFFERTRAESALQEVAGLKAKAETLEKVLEQFERMQSKKHTRELSRAEKCNHLDVDAEASNASAGEAVLSKGESSGASRGKSSQKAYVKKAPERSS